jgi:tRNA modification GTPase
MEAAVTETTADREDLAEKASEFLLGVLERMGISADIDIKDDPDKTVLEIQTKDTELVIGRRGVVMDALQHLVNKVVYRDRTGDRTKPLVVDAGGFRDKQLERLRSIAQKMGEKARIAISSSYPPPPSERARSGAAVQGSVGDRAAMTEDTIAAIATAAGVGGVGIVRLSGPAAIAIAAAALGIAPGQLDRRVRVGWVHDRQGRALDQVLAFAMRAPASFTGEDVAELQGHGGPQNLERMLAALVERGARIAEPGEFTRRAVARGKLDLLRAEALLAVIHAGSERAWRLAQDNLGGRLGGEAAALERRALAALAEVEGGIDFPEDDLEVVSAAAVDGELAALEAACRALVEGFRHARAVSGGVTVALVGPVNVGKSSLLNALVGRERALVAAAPGTTRDWLEVSDVWSGVAVTLVDTAGLRVTDDPIEQRGIALGEARVASADVVVVVNDGEAPWDGGARYGERALVVRSKVDLIGEAALRGAGLVDLGPQGLATSATTGQGLDALRRRVLAVAGVADQEGSEQAFVTTARQKDLARVARDAFGAALVARRAARPPEVVAVELREAVRALARLRGVEVGERVLDEVFARFCIGK